MIYIIEPKESPLIFTYGADLSTIVRFSGYDARVLVWDNKIKQKRRGDAAIMHEWITDELTPVGR